MASVKCVPSFRTLGRGGLNDDRPRHASGNSSVQKSKSHTKAISSAPMKGSPLRAVAYAGNVTATRQVLKKLAPRPIESRDAKPVKPPTTNLAATHPAAYNGAQGAAFPPNTYLHHDSAKAKMMHFQYGPSSSSSGLEPLPLHPLFPSLYQEYPMLPPGLPVAIKKETKPTPPVPVPVPHWAVSVDPMRQTSATPPDWHGKVGVLRADTSLSLGNVISPELLTGLPLGGMVEIADYYGPSSDTEDEEASL